MKFIGETLLELNSLISSRLQPVLMSRNIRPQSCSVSCPTRCSVVSRSREVAYASSSSASSKDSPPCWAASRACARTVAWRRCCTRRRNSSHRTSSERWSSPNRICRSRPSTRDGNSDSRWSLSDSADCSALCAFFVDRAAECRWMDAKKEDENVLSYFYLTHKLVRFKYLHYLRINICSCLQRMT